jgi:hypothetical protein
VLRHKPDNLPPHGLSCTALPSGANEWPDSLSSPPKICVYGRPIQKPRSSRSRVVKLWAKAIFNDTTAHRFRTIVYPIHTTRRVCRSSVSSTQYSCGISRNVRGARVPSWLDTILQSAPEQSHRRIFCPRTNVGTWYILVRPSGFHRAFQEATNIFRWILCSAYSPRATDHPQYLAVPPIGT